MSFAAPVARDSFIFNGDLYVEVDNYNRHKRASILELTALLRPNLKPSKTMPSIPDPVGHWYEAQLIHYGLPPSKTKAVAKVRLLDALNAGKLVVPPEILKVENQLRKEYNAADRKARAAYKAQMAGETEVMMKGKEAPAGTKRKQSEEGPAGMSFNFQFNIGAGGQAVQVVRDTGGDRGESAVKKMKTSGARVTGNDKTMKPVAKKSTSKVSAKQSAAIKKDTTTNSLVAGTATPDVSSSKNKPVKKQTARRTLGPPWNGKRDPDVMRELALKEELATRDSETKNKPAPKKLPQVQKDSAAKKDAAVEKSPTTRKAPTKGPAVRNEPSNAKPSTVKNEPKTNQKPKSPKDPSTKTNAKVKKDPKMKTEPTIRKAPVVKKEPPFKSSPTVKKEPVTQSDYSGKEDSRAFRQDTFSQYPIPHGMPFSEPGPSYEQDYEEDFADD
ncbi:hypothetical protein MMC08_008500, partial [Hypocenomyce scalaris]|nr:hypothetical protein [Hypocenomyce scalaris]